MLRRLQKADIWSGSIASRVEQMPKAEGHFCLVRTSCLPENYMDKQDIDLTGFFVIDENAGCIGKVVRIDENPAHALLVVDRSMVADSSEGREDEVLIHSGR